MGRMRQLMEGLIKRRVNSVLYLIGKCRGKDYNIENTIVISASPRGGSTWLAEILKTLPGYSILWEPLTLDAVPEARDVGFNWRTYIPSGTEWPEVENFLRKVLKGQFITLQTMQACGLSELLSTKGWIVKFCRANMLLKWMTEKYPTKKPILLIRHPCAVVASQMKHGQWIDVHSPRVDPRFIKDYPQFGTILNKLKTWEEVLAGTWCLEYFVPLSTQKPSPWLLVTYEKLVRDGENEINRIFNSLGFVTPTAAIKHLRMASFTTKKGSPILKSGDQLAGWRKYLTGDQVERVLNVVSAFGLDFYSDKLEPDYDRLMEKPVEK